MKKVTSLIASILLFLSLCGCSALGELNGIRVASMKNWSFQYNEGTKDFSLFFDLTDKSGKSLSANADVDIRIVNDEGEEVYRGSKSITVDDFGYYNNALEDDMHLADVRISLSDVKEGKSSSGTVYFTVTSKNVFAFAEVECTASHCLPIKDIELICELPCEVDIRNLRGIKESGILIEDVSYVFEKGYFPSLNITVKGTKTYDASSLGYSDFYFKLYDSEGYVVDSGVVLLSSLSVGDKFKDDSIYIYDITPGETYTLKFSDSRS